MVNFLLYLVSGSGRLGLSTQYTPREIDKDEVLGDNGDNSGSRVGVVWMEVGGGIVRARVSSYVYALWWMEMARSLRLALVDHLGIIPGRVLVTPGSVITTGSILVTPGSVVVTPVIVTPGSVVVTPGSVVVTPGSVVVTPGSVVVTTGSYSYSWKVTSSQVRCRKAHYSGSDRICSFRLMGSVSGGIIKRKFKEWKQLVENQTGRTVKKLRTDNGLEFCNREFEQLCIESGIARHLTVAGKRTLLNATSGCKLYVRLQDLKFRSSFQDCRLLNVLGFKYL
ncbi:retrovirus-related pol polyprotein from transposon TNT 1-94, partial [Tanacetum coccineum]